MTLLKHQLKSLLKAMIILFISLFAIPLQAKVDQAQIIQKPVIQLHDTLIQIMKNADSMHFQKRYALVEKVINEHFYTPLIAKVVLSRYWKLLDEQTQRKFTDLFNRLTILTYVDRFNSFNNESFKYLSIVPMKKNRFMIKTELSSPNDAPVSLNYIVQSEGTEWKIISVIANGINDLSLKRAEYSSIIKAQGFDVLITKLEEKINNLTP